MFARVTDLHTSYRRLSLSISLSSLSLYLCLFHFLCPLPLIPAAVRVDHNVKVEEMARMSAITDLQQAIAAATGDTASQVRIV